EHHFARASGNDTMQDFMFMFRSQALSCDPRRGIFHSDRDERLGGRTRIGESVVQCWWIAMSAAAALARIGYRCGNQIVCREPNMNQGTFARRDVLKLTAAAGATALPAARTFWPSAAHAAGAPAYDPDARFDLAISEAELRRNS